MADTEAVAVMLGEAMRDGDPSAAEEPGELAIVARSNGFRFDGLDLRFHSILSRLLTRPLWRRAEFESLAREFNLMPQARLTQ